MGFGGRRPCSNPAIRRVGGKLLCEKHLRGEAVQITITFELEVLDGTDAAKIALAVKRSVDLVAVKFRSGGGPIVDTDGAVLGQWKAEHIKKRKEAA